MTRKHVGEGRLVERGARLWFRVDSCVGRPADVEHRIPDLRAPW